MISSNNNLMLIRNHLQKLMKSLQLIFPRVFGKISSMNEDITFGQVLDVYLVVEIMSVGHGNYCYWVGVLGLHPNVCYQQFFEVQLVKELQKGHFLQYSIRLMEDYVIIGPVLQAIHMSKFKKKPKHIKKYQLNSSKTYRPRQNYSICYDIPSYSHTHSGRSTLKPQFNTSKADFFITSGAENNQKNKYKMKFILEKSEKLREDTGQVLKQNNKSEFFVKRLIEPKMSRQHTSRTLTLIKSQPSSVGSYFYDANIQLIRKKSRKCIIFPQKKQKIQDQSLRISCGQKIDIRKFVRQEWEQQKQRRRAQCKTSCMARHKNLTQKQTKRIEQQLKKKQNQQRVVKTSMSQRTALNRTKFNQLYNENILPLSKDEIRTKTCVIMHKYGVDTNKCCLKMG